MVVLGAFLVGYWMGTNAGPDGMRTLIQTGQKVLQSEEFQTTLQGVIGMAQGAVGQVIESQRDNVPFLRAA